MPDRFFGELSTAPIGTVWPTRQAVSAAGVHRPTMGGISGVATEGSDSIVVSGGYEDDEDLGDEIIYTGAGGNDSATGRQVADQTLSQPGNAGLVTSELHGLPVRVVRGSNGDRGHAPVSGYRYDGLYRVQSHWSEMGRSGHRIWRFRLIRLEPDEARPYTPAASLPTGSQRPSTRTGVVTRVVRDTAVSRSVKRLHDGHCQVCDKRLDVPGGFIAEGAHIRPLGRPHYGPDEPANMLCLCPNHHALLDAGGIYISANVRVFDHSGVLIGPLSNAKGHVVDRAHLQYHCESWGHPS